ncbi:polysaccharide pyruvyl transferase CsaB [Paraclostridium sordellii]|uniref:Polysaccharide pyruvyl transferase CsaB n=1 Tax=Paraclostridium sordellii TaxID=1505 RepID=A0A0C7QLQ5_PARSO|nr:polysaccharide pyruvyl transferase CsaB [Paeniclostridium sordellii]CEN79737.1 polysaccharide pyruvyl transferase CsaB [[Clostridium] sordellii] [Paeniclostridium sordellii]CEO12198.1 polysaccharide pyruvyl transferase CsaB [[Clostridium] sordellii] [Paeniclostridium sordellii]CEP87784.1 polysaccharide pyruvyl transferase CsaB [[Clostridium] sordellii] [Paeniclostridium sordellii]CEP97480.1 polysaccharide pyruvyl transferase CsaB [[Clostridium] sordellii] [Paeniclostridium sordellii]CEQ0116
MRVVISGYYGFENIGDEAILKSIIEALKEESKDIEITVLSNNPMKTKQTYNVNSINRWSFWEIYKELKISSGLISGGGSLLQDVTSSRSIAYYTFIIGLAKFAKKPVFVYAQGIGPINKPINRKITKYFLNKVEYISLRDRESSNLMKSIGVNRSFEIVPDPVMGLDFRFSEKFNIKKNYIIISVRDWKSKTDYLKQIAYACNYFLDNGIEIKLLPMHEKEDEKTSKRLADMINGNVEILTHDMNINKRINYIKNAKIMIGMRLHALVFAGNLGTPMIGISYDPKIDSYLKTIKQPCVGNVSDGISSSELIHVSNYILKDYDNVKLELKKNTIKLKKEAKLTANKAINLFNKFN